jgi:hypothetical protein
MSGLVDVALILGALMWVCSGYQTSHALFWFGFFYSLGYAYSADVPGTQSCLNQ